MKKILALALAAALSVSMLTACGSKTETPDSNAPSSSTQGNVTLTPEEQTDRYLEAFDKSEIDPEMLEINPPFTSPEEGDGELIMDYFGFDPEQMESYAMSFSMMNVMAYGVAAIKPAEGEEENVLASLQAWVDQQNQAFEHYLADQYEVAQQAKLETLSDGTILLVMCENSDQVFENMSGVILGK